MSVPLLDPHELSLAFPDMAPEQFRRLSADIKANGLNHPIVLLEGKILDGRHRYKACREHGIKPTFRTFNEGADDEYCHGDPVAFVQSENAARRQLTESQLAHAITHPNILDYERRKAAERSAAAGKANLPNANESVPAGTVSRESLGRVTEKLAEKSGVGARTVARAIKVREEGIPEVNEAVSKGEVALNMAEKIVRLNPAAQKRVIEAPATKRGEALQEAMNRSDAAVRRNARVSLPPAQQIATPFVRKFLSAIERLAMICAEDGAKDGAAIATKFLAEMDFDATPLVLQLERAEPVIRALAIITQAQARRVA